VRSSASSKPSRPSTVFGQSGFITPGGTMNVYLGGFLGFLFMVGLLVWAMPRLDRAADAT
jgi:hypothetical protein